MYKNFFEQNDLRKLLNDKFKNIDSQIIETEIDKYDYLRFLIYSCAKSYYILPSIDLQSITDKLKEWFEKEHNLNVKTSIFNDIIVLHLSPTKGIAKFLGILKPVSLLLYKNGSYFAYFFMNPEWFEKPEVNEKYEKSNFINNLFYDNIEKFIFEKIQTFNTDKNLLNFASDKNCFVEDFLPKYQQFVLTQLQNYEVLLAWLAVSSVKNFALNKDVNKNLNWFFVLTNFESLLIGFDKNGDVTEAIDLQNRKINIKKSLRNTISTDQYEWMPTLTNSSDFTQVVDCANAETIQRIKKVAIKNVENSKKEFKFFAFAKFLLFLINDLTTPLSVFLLDFIENKEKATQDYTQEDKLNSLLLNILNSGQAEEQLVFWFNDWQPDIEKSVFIVKMFFEVAENVEHLKKILPFHTLVHKNAIEKEKDVWNRILIDIQFIQHLISVEKFSEAEKLIYDDLKHIPDQDFFELIPSEDINPTGQLSGQYLKVLLLELLSKTKADKEAQKILLQITQLQPLNAKNINEVANMHDEIYSPKAQKIFGVLTGQSVPKNENVSTFKVNHFQSTDFEVIKHPLISKKGVWTSFTKWISNSQAPNFEDVKKLAESFNPLKHKYVADIIADLLTLFNMGSIEVFVVHGNSSIGIRAYEGTPSFILIGADHLNQESPHYLTVSELRFLLAVEMSFLYFNFARITSQDIWRGAMEKGNLVFDALTSVFTVTGLVSSLVKNLSKVSTVSAFLEKSTKVSKLLLNVEKIDNLDNKSKGILNVASQMMQSISSKSKNANTSKQYELIAASRIMQITADRVGLLMCDDPVSAIRAIFLSSKDITVYLSQIEKYGLVKFVEKTDDKGNYINQNFAIRIASIFSFWMSEEFENLKKKIVLSTAK